MVPIPWWRNIDVLWTLMWAGLLGYATFLLYVIAKDPHGA